MAVILVWMVTPRVLEVVWGIEPGTGSGTREVIRYFDITPESPTGTMQLPKELADSLGLGAPATQ